MIIIEAMEKKKRPGRPPIESPRKGQTVYLDADLVAWMDEHLPRKVSVSAFVNQALRAHIESTAQSPTGKRNT